MPDLKSAAKNLGALALGCVVALGLLEIALRIKNPFESRVRADRIILPAHRRYVLVGGPAFGPTDTVIHTKNSLGFRGPQPPADGIARHFSIIAIGGSSTEGYYLPDGATWPERLAALLEPRFSDLWVNNAGLDGHSTYGHQVLMRDYVGALKPRVVLFLVGANDVGSDYWGGDHVLSQIRSGVRFGTLEGFVKSGAAYSEVMNVALNLYRYWRARARGVPHRRFDWAREPVLPYPEPDLAAVLETHRREWIPLYDSRVRALVSLTREYGIVPVLITQPVLYGDVRDDVSGADLAAIPVGPRPGHTQWRIMQQYNDATRKVAQAEGVFLVDLAAEMPKSSRYFYDPFHFTIAGADLVARIIDRHLEPYLRTLRPGAALRARQPTR
jgi:lysophospholipase L1-like esterase